MDQGNAINICPRGEDEKQPRFFCLLAAETQTHLAASQASGRCQQLPALACPPFLLHIRLTKALQGAAAGWQAASHPALGCSSGVPLAPALVARVPVDVWHGKAVTSALSGAQPSQKAAPQPGGDRNNSPKRGWSLQVLGFGGKWFSCPAKMWMVSLQCLHPGG